MSVALATPAYALDADRLARRYADWVARGKPPSPTTSLKPKPVVASKSARTIEALTAASGHRCGICGNQLRATATIDHVVPWSAGGRNAANRVPAHAQCNQRKGNRLPTGCELIWLAGVNARLGIAA